MDIILDSETTGLSMPHPVQLAVTDLDGNPLLDTLVALPPGVSIEPGASAAHGIAEQDLIGAPTFAEIAPSLGALLGQADTVYIYNADYDTKVLLNAAHAAGLLLPRFKAECVMLAYAARFGAIGNKGPRWHKLGAAYEQQYGGTKEVISGHWHSALFDCQMTAKVLKALNGPGFKAAHEECHILFTEAVLARGRAGEYIQLKSPGGISVNVFSSQLWQLPAEAPAALVLKGARENPDGFTLPFPVLGVVTYRGEWPELVRVV